MEKCADLQAFVTVVDTGSFSAAGERLEIAKSMVSRRVIAVERRLGVKLLNRTTRRLSLTDSGRTLHERASRILADLDETEQAVTSAHGELGGRLRIAAPLSFGLQHLAPAIIEFLQAHEQLAIDIDLNEPQVDIVEEGFDTAVRIGHLEDSTLVTRGLSCLRRVTAASPAYLNQQGAPAEPGELTQHRGISYANMPRHLQRRCKTRDGKSVAPQVPSRLQTNNGEMQANAAKAGLGITVLPKPPIALPNMAVLG